MKKTIFVFTLFLTSAFAQVNISDVINYKLTDQFEKEHTLSKDTKKLLFTFTKDMGHIVNDFLGKQSDDFLVKHQTQLITDLSSAPGLIKYFFIKPRLKNYKYSILTIEDEEIANRYKNPSKEESIMVVTLDNQKVENIEYINTIEELEKIFIRKF